jgi:putative ABC transport system permease protein
MHDLRLAVRALRATPIVSLVAVLSLALGIGANTAIFSLVDSLLLRPLPVADPQRLVTITSPSALRMGLREGIGWKWEWWDRLRRHAQAFDGAIAWSSAHINLAPAGPIDQADLLVASGAYFTTLGVRALLGRTFTAADDVHGGGPDGPVAVIGYGFWQRRFGGRADAIGTRFAIEGVPFTIIGVTPPEFFGIDVGHAYDIAIPLETESLMRGEGAGVHSSHAMMLLAMLRLKPSQSIEAATAALGALQNDIYDVTPETRARLPAFWQEPFLLAPAARGTTTPGAGVPGLRYRYERALLTLLAVVSLVLLIACANIANLLLARAAARQHDLSVRRALGASRWRLARPLLIESALLAGSGAVLGLAVASFASRILVAQLSTPMKPVILDLSLDARVLAFTLIVTAVTTLFFGTVPALRASRAKPIEALTQRGSRTSDAFGARASVSSSLVVVQVALSLVLIVAAGLFVRTFERLARAPLGFEYDRLLVINVDIARQPIDHAVWLATSQHLVDTVARVPGVVLAAGSIWTPLNGGGGEGAFDPAFRHAGNKAGNKPAIAFNFVTPDWLTTYGMALRAGRHFDVHDTGSTAPVAVVNEAYARAFLQGTGLGETIDFGSDGAHRPTVVGIVGDAHYGSIRGDAPPTIYIPLAQSLDAAPPNQKSIALSVRGAAGSPALLIRSLAGALTAADRTLSFSFRPLEDRINGALTQERLVAMVAGGLGALALLLAGLGLYGVTAYAVSRRRVEIGIRLALGAAPRRVVRLVLSRVAWLVAAGVAVGAATSAWIGTFVAPLLFGVTPRDPATFIAAALTLAVIGAIAGGLPAARAARLDPARVLRDQ